MESISGCYYTLLKTLLGRESDTVPQGYGMYFRLKLSLIERSTGESVKYSSTRIQNVLQALIISCWKLLWGESQICTDPKGCGMYLRLYLSLLKTLLGECKMQFHKGMECILDWNYLLLKGPLGGVRNTVLQGYGMCFRLQLSHVESPAGERIKYSSTRIWNVF